MLTSSLTSSASLPIPLTPLIGRAGEVEQVGALLERPEIRLVTLLGPGGIGKTRLALAVAERLQDDWRDGVVFVALQSISEPELVASAIAQALGVRESGEQPLLDSLRAALHHRNLLLILDNFEQVLLAGAASSPIC